MLVLLSIVGSKWFKKFFFIKRKFKVKRGKRWKKLKFFVRDLGVLHGAIALAIKPDPNPSKTWRKK